MGQMAYFTILFIFYVRMYGYIRSTYSKWVINLFQKSQALLHWPCCVVLRLDWGAAGARIKKRKKKKKKTMG